MHVAIIMDGNGRWATRRGLPRTAGHKEGAKAVSATIEAAARYNIETLTLYAFSAANWERPSSEVSALMRLLRRYLLTETHRCLEQSIRISVIGRRDRLNPSLVRSIEQAERLTANCRGLHVRVAIDYSAQYSLLEAARRAWQHPMLDIDEFRRMLDEVNHSALPAGAVDLLIRTGGEKRLSDFLLWECAYAELYFTDCLWPDFNADGFRLALEDFASRQRRFGRVIPEPEDHHSPFLHTTTPLAGSTTSRR
jgi:undecaprenyl diphosphate synthase